jgi:hypothetical protein
LQLTHAPDIKSVIDRGWGVQHNKHKKNQVALPTLDPNDPQSRDKLALLAIGQDSQRKRYWVTDGPCTIPTLALSRFPVYLCLLMKFLFFFFSSCGPRVCRLFLSALLVKLIS